ncbi:MAG: hypothetical protein HIU84_11725 [Acidobacteria bacterium]|nr:hypothetical protein [Acidobacteriota bacterium]
MPHGDGPNLDFRRLITVLDRHEVDYVLVGGAAAAILGAERLTQDVDCVISRELTNLERVAATLRELDARLRVAGMSDEEARALNVQLDVHSLQRMGNSTWTMRIPANPCTRFGVFVQ